jgi:hypothetical protein
MKVWEKKMEAKNEMSNNNALRLMISQHGSIKAMWTICGWELESDESGCGGWTNTKTQK